MSIFSDNAWQAALSDKRDPEGMERTLTASEVKQMAHFLRRSGGSRGSSRVYVPSTLPAIQPDRSVGVGWVLAHGLLEKHGHTVTIAVKGHYAIKAFEERTFDLILMDMRMPGMDCLQAPGPFGDYKKVSREFQSSPQRLTL